jgi:hypothetical protein
VDMVYITTVTQLGCRHRVLSCGMTVTPTVLVRLYRQTMWIWFTLPQLLSLVVDVECYLVGCGAMQFVESQLMCRRNMSSVSKNKPSKKLA